MILQNQNKRELIRDGEELVSTQMTIDPDSVGILMDFLSKNIYSDYEGSTVRETVSNAFDSHVSIDSKEPILVKLEKINSNWEFSVEDFGSGMNQDIVDNVIKKYLKSTKRNCDKQLGQKGIGFKCPLAYTAGQPFFFIGRKDDIETKWMMYEAEEGNNIDTIYEKETTEKNGVKVIVPLKSYSDAATFSKKIREQLSYFKGVYVVDEYRTFDNNFKIFENNLFSWSEIQNDNYVHISLGQVYYPLEFSKLGISSIYIPIAINIGLNDGIEPVLSREAITYTPHAKTVILNKIKEVANYFITKYNENTQEKETFFEAFPFIGKSSKYVTLAEREFCINDIIQYGDIPLNELKVKNINLLDLTYYKRCDYFFPELNPIVDNNYDSWKRKHLYKSTKDYFLNNGRKIVVVDKFPERRVKTFLQEKYKNQNILIVKQSHVSFFRKIKNIKRYGILDTKEKLKEFLFIENQLRENFTYELNIEDTQEYIDWLEVEKEYQKQRRKEKAKDPYYVSKSLNKEEGDVTIHYSKKTNGKYTFEAQAYPIKNLHKNKFLTIYFDKEEKEIAKDFISEFRDDEGRRKNTSNIRIALVGKREKTKLQNLHNFKNIYQMMSEGNKKFRQIVTAELINELLQDKDAVEKFKSLKPYLNKISEDLKLLISYRSHHLRSLDNEVWNAMRIVAREQNLFDFSIYDVYLRVKQHIDLLDFASLLESPSYRESQETTLKREKAITRFLLFGKKYKNAFDDFELIEKKVEEPELIQEDSPF